LEAQTPVSKETSRALGRSATAETRVKAAINNSGTSISTEPQTAAQKTTGIAGDANNKQGSGNSSNRRDFTEFYEQKCFCKKKVTKLLALTVV
jgi:hypothetical protein